MKWPLPNVIGNKIVYEIGERGIRIEEEIAKFLLHIYNLGE